MGNMSYCRFENTLNDLRDCRDHLDDELSPDEHKARTALLELCAEMLEEIGVEVGDDVKEQAIGLAAESDDEDEDEEEDDDSDDEEED